MTVLYLASVEQATSCINNSAGHAGGGIIADNTSLNFSGTSNFINNWIDGGHGAAHSGGVAISIYANSVFIFNGTSNFINNSAYLGGAIFTDSTVLNFSGINSFNNSADSGCAMYADTNSALTLNETIYFTNNGHYIWGRAHTGCIY